MKAPRNPLIRLASPPRAESATRRSEDSTAFFYFNSLEADSDLPEVQTIIRDAIRRGTIRVQPIPGCGQRVQIVPLEVSGALAPASS